LKIPFFSAYKGTTFYWERKAQKKFFIDEVRFFNFVKPFFPVPSVICQL